jgi:V/A-type H+/Na+-transporting ATPase subunit D
MAKIRLTKSELKTQKDRLRRFARYLPTLELKKMQLIQELGRIQERIDALLGEIEEAEARIRAWVDVFAEEVAWPEYYRVEEVRCATGNIAGIDIPLFVEVVYADRPYDLAATPLWVDPGIAAVKGQLGRRAELRVTEKQRDIVQEELRLTIQRIKLFEEVKIPEARENIRVIQIFMGDQQTAAVVRGKIAKAKIAGAAKDESG